MAEFTASMDGPTIMRDVTINVTLHLRRWWRVRLGCWIIKLGCRVAGCRAAFDGEEPEKS